MKKMLCSLVLLTLTASMALADEGMWMLPLLQKMNAGAMKDLGCRLTPEEIYSVNHTSLKDAIVHFGGGCTGEVISREGLVVTNHHCGYSHIQKLSSPEHNYLEDGYWAMTRAEELPAKGLTVTFLESMTDVTEILEKVRTATLKQYKDSTNREVLAVAAVNQTREALQKQAEAEVPHSQARITSFYNSNVFYLIVSKTYTDIRFVGAPPASVGKFGGETDNWMWPRHTGDFSMFRIYAGADNEPADYSEDNVPYVPKQALKVSLKGYQDGDFTMIMGYPGRTQRFQTAAQLQQMLNRQAISVEARTLRQDIMWEAMEADPKVRLQYANKYASSANGWKKWQGEKLAFEKLGILEREQQKEAAFMAWVGKNKKRTAQYGTALDDIAEAVAASADASNATTLLLESVYQIELLQMGPHFLQFFSRGLDAGTQDTLAVLRDARKQMDALYKDYSEPLDRKEAVALLTYYREHADSANFLKIPGEDFATMDIPAFVDKLFEESIFTSPEKLETALQGGLPAVFADPTLALYGAFYGAYRKLQPQANLGREQLAEGSRAFTAGLMAWKKGEPSYPDANSTMRLTYGKVGAYSPKDGVTYKFYTTLTGVMEKEDPNNYEFIVPAKLKALYAAKDFGPYAMDDGRVPTCFLTNNDITGGNSGSPVLDADGCLIGLAFDGNWESMSSDVMFEPDLQRCICVDIRYVLFLVDKLGGASHIVEELELVK